MIIVVAKQTNSNVSIFVHKGILLRLIFLLLTWTVFLFLWFIFVPINAMKTFCVPCSTSWVKIKLVKGTFLSYNNPRSIIR